MPLSSLPPTVGVGPQPVNDRVRRLLAAAAADELFAPPAAVDPAGTPGGVPPEQAPGAVPLDDPKLSAGAAVAPQRPAVPGATDYSSLTIDPSSRTRPTADPDRSGLLARLRLGGAAVQGLGAIVGGNVGGYLMGGGGGFAQGAGLVAQKDAAQLALEQEAYDQWLAGVTTHNRGINLKQVEAQGEAAERQYEAGVDDFEYGRDRGDRTQDRATDRGVRASERKEDAYNEDVRDRRDHNQQVERDEAAFQRQLRLQREREAAAAKARQDQFEYSLRLSRERPRTGTGTTNQEDRAGAQAVIGDLDQQISARAQEVARLRQQLNSGAPSERNANVARLTAAERLLDGMQRERRGYVRQLRDVGDVGMDPGTTVRGNALARLNPHVDRAVAVIQQSENPGAALARALASLDARNLDETERAYMEDRLYRALGY